MSGLAAAVMFQPAPENVATFFICTVVLPVPPTKVACLPVSMSQKEWPTVASHSLVFHQTSNMLIAVHAPGGIGHGNSAAQVASHQTSDSPFPDWWCCPRVLHNRQWWNQGRSSERNGRLDYLSRHIDHASPVFPSNEEQNHSLARRSSS